MYPADSRGSTRRSLREKCVEGVEGCRDDGLCAQEHLQQRPDAHRFQHDSVSAPKEIRSRDPRSVALDACLKWCIELLPSQQVDARCTRIAKAGLDLSPTRDVETANDDVDVGALAEAAPHRGADEPPT